MRSFRRHARVSVMKCLQWIVPVLLIGAVLFFALDTPGGDAAFQLAQSQPAVVEGMGGSGGPNPEVCTQCYEQLQKDNRECETLSGQDWKICREAAATAYRRCSTGC